MPGSTAAQPAADAARRTAPTVKLKKVVGGLDQPIDVASPPGSSDLYIAQKCGVIKVRTGTRLRTAGSVKDLVRCDEERGLLALAFDPDFATNHWLYVYLVRKTKDVQIGRFEVRNKRLVAGSYHRIITIRHRQTGDHNGGKMVFDADGLMYVAIGDGGGVGNPFGHSQDHASLLGKILRIDVHQGARYSIPPGNPLVGQPGRPEIWAIGLRNPWRMSLDPATDRLWIGDVGQDKVEEVDSVSSTTGRLRNFGWSHYEGRRVYDSGERLRGGKLVMPTFTYKHPAGEAVIGGAVYRGSASPALQGYYVYGDINGWVAGFDIADHSARFKVDHHGPLMTVSEAGGEIYAGYAGGNLYRVVVP